MSGPYPADTIFFRAARGEFAAVVAMYHDQGLGPLKTLAFDTGVNVTLGLPIIRTSVDHGTAFDIAGKGVASPREPAGRGRTGGDDGAPPATLMAVACAPKKSLGQHFLRDRGVLEKILHAADAVGRTTASSRSAPGTRTLTAPLAAGLRAPGRARDRPPAGARACARCSRPAGTSRSSTPTSCSSTSGPSPPHAPLKCVSNLPYNIATAVLDRLLARRGMFTPARADVPEGGRRCGSSPGPGIAAYGSLSLATQYRAEASLVCTVPRRAFSPPPAVESAVVRLVPRARAAAAAGAGADLRAAAARRLRAPAQDLPQLRGPRRPPVSPEALAAGLAALGLTERARAEEIPLAGFLRLARQLTAAGARSA